MAHVPSMCMTAGTMRHRMTTASGRMATARPSPNCWSIRSSLRTKAPKTNIMMAAALEDGLDAVARLVTAVLLEQVGGRLGVGARQREVVLVRGAGSGGTQRASPKPAGAPSAGHEKVRFDPA